MAGLDVAGAGDACQLAQSRTRDDFPARAVFWVGHDGGVRQHERAFFAVHRHVIPLNANVDCRPRVLGHQHHGFHQAAAGYVTGERLVETILAHETTFPLDRCRILPVDDERTLGNECHVPNAQGYVKLSGRVQMVLTGLITRRYLARRSTFKRRGIYT